MGRKIRKCRICKKRPVWTRGDVKDPGPFCKRCYHKHVSPGRAARSKGMGKMPRGTGDDMDALLLDESFALSWAERDDREYLEVFSLDDITDLWVDETEDEFPVRIGRERVSHNSDEILLDGQDDEIPF